MSFLDFYLSSNWERGSGKRNLGIKENGHKVTYLIFFRRGSTGESFLLSRANRLCSIFLHWREEPGVLRVSVILLSSTRSKMAMVRPPATNPAQKLNFLILYFRWGEGSPNSVLGSQPIIWLLSLSSSGVQRPEVTKYQHLVSPVWPTFFVNGHFFWRLDTVNSNTRSSNFISLLPVGYHVTLMCCFPLIS